MRYGNRFAAFADQVRAATSPADMLMALQREITGLGFPNLIYEAMRPPSHEMRPPLFVTNYPADWVKHYISQRYELHDPVISYGQQAVVPFLWEDSYRGRSLTGTEAEVMNVAGEFGMRSGGVVPVQSPGGAGWAYLCVTSDMRQAEFARLFAEHAAEMLLLTCYMHEAFPPVSLRNEGAPVRRLTPREVDVLSWMAVGKTRQQAAYLMRISDQTAKDHLRRACQRLQASNTTHAVSIAVSRGLLRL